MALGFASALAHGGMEVARGVVTIAYDDSAVAAGLAETEAATKRGAGVVNKVLMGIGIGTAFAFGEGAKMAIDFDAKMRLIQTSAGGTSRDVRILTKDILNLAASGKSAEGPEELANAMYHLKSLGLDNATAMGVLRTSLKGAEVGLADLEGTANALGAAVRVGIKGTEDYSHAMALLAGTTGAGNMRMDDLVAALGTGVLPTFKAVGLSLHDFGAALATMTDEAIPANEAATRLRMTIQLLAGDTPKANKQLERIGLTGMQVAEAMRTDGLAGAIELLRDHLERIQDPAKRFSLLTKAFGARSSSALILLINNLDVLKQKYGQIDTAASHFKANVLEAQQSPSFKLHAALVQIETAMTRLGAAIVPAVVAVGQLTAGLAAFISDLGILKPLLLFLVATYVAMKVKALALWAANTLVTTGYRLMGVQAATSLKSMIVWEERAGAQVAILRGEVATLGPTAVASGAEASAGMAAIGTAATTAGAEVGAVRAALLGLAGIAVPAIAIPIILQYHRQIIGGIESAGDKVFGALGIAGGASFKGTYADYKKLPGWARAQVDAALKKQGRDFRSLPGYDGSIAPQGDNRSLPRSQGNADDTNLKVQHGFNASQAAAFIKEGSTDPRRTLKALQLATSIDIAESKASMTKTQTDDKAAYQEEIAFWRYILHSFKLTGEQRAQAWKNIAAAQQQIDSIDAAGAKAVADSKKKKSDARKKAIADALRRQETADQNLLPFGIQEDEAKARLTKTVTDDVRAFREEQAFLQKRIDYTLSHVRDQERREKILTDLYNRLADVREKIANAKKDSSNRAAAAEALAALQTRRGFMASFAPNVYYKGTDGKLHLGPEAAPQSHVTHKTVTVNQYGVRSESEMSPLQQARFAAEAALG